MKRIVHTALAALAAVTAAVAFTAAPANASLGSKSASLSIEQHGAGDYRALKGTCPLCGGRR